VLKVNRKNYCFNYKVYQKNRVINFELEFNYYISTNTGGPGLFVLQLPGRL